MSWNIVNSTVLRWTQKDNRIESKGKYIFSRTWWCRLSVPLSVRGDIGSSIEERKQWKWSFSGQWRVLPVTDFNASLSVDECGYPMQTDVYIYTWRERLLVPFKKMVSLLLMAMKWDCLEASAKSKCKGHMQIMLVMSTESEKSRSMAHIRRIR